MTVDPQPSRDESGARGEWQVALDAHCELAERPVWDGQRGRLVWTDCEAGVVHAFHPDSGDSILWSSPGSIPIGMAQLRRNGGLVVAAGRVLVLLDCHGREDRSPIDVPFRGGDVRFNDGACDAAGRLLIGTTGGDVEGLGELFSVSPGGEVTRLLDGLTESNGLGWSADGRAVYHIDSGEPVIHVYDYDLDSGRLGARADFARIDPRLGCLDGLTIDDAGNLWVAIWQGHQIRQYSPRGQLLQIISTPVSQPTCPGFGGRSLDTLYVTSGWAGLSPAARKREPWAGHLLAVSGLARGVPPHRYAG